MSDANGESPTKDTEGSHVDKDGPSTVQNETTTDGDGESAKGDGHAKEETESIKPAEQKETNHQEIEAKAGTTEQTETTQQEHVAEATGAAESQPQKVDLSAESVEQTEAQHAGNAAEAVEQAGGQTQKAESPTKETNDQEAVDQAGATEHTETETNQQKHEHIANATSEQPSSPQKDSKSTPEQEIKNESKAKEGNTTTRNFKPKSSPPATQDDLIIVPNITNPTPLEARILAIHGQFKGIRSVNSWKAIRCIRNNQDMGSLWEVRQGWYLKHHKHK